MKIEIKDVSYHVETYGKGFPLILLHGFTGDASTWTPFFQTWQRHSKLIVPDIIGHGKTSSPDDLERYDITSTARDLKNIIDELGLDQIDLLGYSMGGRLALTFAILFPNKVRKLILESASPGLVTLEEQKKRQKSDLQLANFLMNDGILKFVDYWENIPLFQTLKLLPPSRQEEIRNQRLKNNPIGLANSLMGMGTGSQPSWWKSLNQLPCETLLLTGEKDNKFCQIAEEMMKEIKKGHWIVINQCGHAIHVEEPEKFGTIVSDFLLN